MQDHVIDKPWLVVVKERQKEVALLLGQSQEEQIKRGYFNTLREILQQPATWLKTARAMLLERKQLKELVSGARGLVLTGSGSSEYAGWCLHPTLQSAFSIPVQVIGGGRLLTEGSAAIAPVRPMLVVSLARSGDSPESAGVVSALLRCEPKVRHLVVTCNANGQLATAFQGDPRVRVVVLAPETNDRSLVMTSSFTNIVLAAGFLGMLDAPERYEAQVASLSAIAEGLLGGYFDKLAELARREFHRVVYLASGAGNGAARESALKMLEMTAGRVWATNETYLGLRHGPMSAVHSDTLMVCFLSSSPHVRAYECDLICELNQKHLGMAKLILGENIPSDLLQSGDVAIECAGLSELGDENLPVIQVLVGQLLAFFRSIQEGLRPDSPSEDGVISRVVQEFQLHDPQA
jgi:tagatose-6-phosphate ketose/aldose isomerase